MAPAGGGDATPAGRYAQVAVEVAPAHLDRPFDYAVPDGMPVAVGHRVRLRFAGRRARGWVIGTGPPAAPATRIRPLAALDGERTWFDADELRFYRWVADRYASPLAAVLRHAVPDRVAAVERQRLPTTCGARGGIAAPAAAGWAAYDGSGELLASLAQPAPVPAPAPAWWWQPSPDEDVETRVTELVAACNAVGRRALVLVPDPRAPLARTLLARARGGGVDLRDRRPAERYRAALRCRSGAFDVAVGLRGASLAPMPGLGLLVVVDEASPAYKERRSPRHHAREVALARARFAGATCVLSSQLPGAACWRLLRAGHVRPLVAERRRVRAAHARVQVVDLSDPRPDRHRARLSSEASRALRDAVAAGGAAVVLAARRGEGTVLACSDCGSRFACPVCEGALAPHPDLADHRRCVVCGAEPPADPCPYCGGHRSAPRAAGAGRLAAELGRAFPDAEVTRMEGFDAVGPSQRPAIAVMTRGSVVDRPAWLDDQRAAVTVVLDADALLGRPRYDAGEDALRLWLAALSWSRRVVVQTREPTHLAVGALVRHDAEGFWRREAERRELLGWPPARSLVVVQARGEAGDVAGELRHGVPSAEVLGPDPDGRVLLKTSDLRGTLDALRPLRQEWARRGRGVHIDVDPLVV